ncbi:unnamed protein product [Tenebrio molitor]|nr:unnamed protein product [Tenebrio molitor]
MDSALSKFASSSITKENAISISLGSFHHHMVRVFIFFKKIFIFLQAIEKCLKTSKRLNKLKKNMIRLNKSQENSY